MHHPHYGQVPAQPPPLHPRRHDMRQPPIPPPNMHAAYNPYYHQQMGSPMPAYAPQYASYPQQWFPHPHQPAQHYQAAPPPRQYQPYPQYQASLNHHHAPLIVSSHPHARRAVTPTYPSPVPSRHGPPPPSLVPSSTLPQAPPSPPPSTPGSQIAQQDPAMKSGSPEAELAHVPEVATVPQKAFFEPPVPWLSVASQPFPRRAMPKKRRIPRSTLATGPVTYPAEKTEPESDSLEIESTPTSEQTGASNTAFESTELATPTQSPTPVTSIAASDVSSTQPTTPSSVTPGYMSLSQHTSTQAKAIRPVVPVIPILPVISFNTSSIRKIHRDSLASEASPTPALSRSDADDRKLSVDSNSQPTESAARPADSAKILPLPQPKSWADLVRTKAASTNPVTAGSVSQLSNGVGAQKGESLSDVLNEMNTVSVESLPKVALLKPRGLVNTGNMCYMNSVLQMLVFCIPFYDFLHIIAQRKIHAFKSDTPLLDAVILFFGEFSTIDSASSVEQLRLRLKPEDFEKFGDSFTPEYVYQVIRDLPRFRDMRRGHQQDAQEFLGFLLEELHEECAQAMRKGSFSNSRRSSSAGSTSNAADVSEKEGDWTEVGHKQKPAITRSSGSFATESPVTRIFGGKLRSELKISGSKMSVTLEPYQPLQLDIGSPHIHNIVDALKGLTKPESMQGDFQSPRGSRTTATKQVFIESLPPVLILHLKRFHYDSITKRAEKIWKKVGYPLELEIPKEVFPLSTRNKLTAHRNLPQYRLIGVIYHHGKNANGGHYTVDIRRQDGIEWIRIDDTTIRRVRSEDVAEDGSEEDPKVLAAALQRHEEQKTSANRFEQIDREEEHDDAADKNWSQVNGHSRTKSTIFNGTATPGKTSSGLQTPSQKFSFRDNKVAYLLFYQRIST